ncbi:SGNH/GDSL hydrolase family protein [Nocardioides sp.]|uniref:SGNH/GDSL hydrolase family protein n=1 Tax=Nocardioides sp. TaxID=35761 RepID=UPI00378323E9
MRSTVPLTAAAALLVGLAGCAGAGSDRPEAGPARTTGSPVGAPTAYEEYVALGDSYTAAPLVAPTDTSTTCLRSQVNYPALVAEAMPGTTLTDVSCGGADTGDTVHPQAGRGGAVPPQFDALTPTTDLVTIGLGGNDEGLFGGVLGGCIRLATTDPAGAPCRRAYAGRLPATLADIAGNVAGVVRGVRARAPQARVLVVGYPQIVPAAGTCDLLPIAAGDYPFARRVNVGLTEAVRAGARRAHAEYVDVWAASAGHDICAAEPWVNGRVTRIGTALAYHPFAVEQREVARLVLAHLT